MKETALRIRLLGDFVLRKKTVPVAKVTAVHREVLSQMARLMYDSAGIGLAATQVGLKESMLVADTGKGLYKLINPKITSKEGWQVMEEGCLSIPGVCIKVKRAKKVTVQALDPDGCPVTVEAEDLFACVLQHEIDHLSGKLIIDYASFMDKLKIKAKLSRIKQKAKDEKLPGAETKSCKLQL